MQSMTATRNDVLLLPSQPASTVERKNRLFLKIKRQQKLTTVLGAGAAFLPPLGLKEKVMVGAEKAAAEAMRVEAIASFIFQFRGVRMCNGERR